MNRCGWKRHALYSRLSNYGLRVRIESLLCLLSPKFRSTSQHTITSALTTFHSIFAFAEKQHYSRSIQSHSYMLFCEFQARCEAAFRPQTLKLLRCELSCPEIATLKLLRRELSCPEIMTVRIDHVMLLGPKLNVPPVFCCWGAAPKEYNPPFASILGCKFSTSFFSSTSK